MKCRNPYLKSGPQGSFLYPCGQCKPCRINRRREWTHRIMLEKNLREDNCFVTLTYEDTHLVMSATGYPTLVPLHLQLWLKRFRVAIAPLKIRFYACGEYGDQTQRPHYHVVIFGMPMCMNGRTIRDARTNRPLWAKCCSQCRLVGETWGMGDVELGEVNVESAQYIAQYTTKKMTKADDPRLYGREPEFARMSLKPGIGADFMWEIASSLLKFDLDETQDDVPSSLRHGKRIMPLGRYLRRKLRVAVGKDENAPESTLAEAQARLQPMREAAFENSTSFKEEVMKAADQAVAQAENREKLWKKRGNL